VTVVVTRPIRVLHLEDSPRDAELVRQRLEADGVLCDIQVARGKDSFESALANQPFDLIISDYNLPGYDGITALRQAQVVQPDVPVILVSGTVSEEQAVKCLQIGATDYLLKARLDRLAPAVQRAIQEAETRLTRKRAEGSLAQSERRKAAILDSVLDCIVTIDADGVVMEFNAAAERTFGYTKAQAIGRRLAELIIPLRFRERHAAGMARYLATQQGDLLGRMIELTALRSDGSELPVELTITAIHSENAPIFTGVLRDITARKRAEEKEAAAEAAVRGERDRAQRFLDTAEVTLLALDVTGHITLINRTGCDLLGWTEPELLGRDFLEMCLPERSRVVLRKKFETVIRGDLTPVEAAVLTKSGEERLVEWRNTLLKDEAGQVIGTFSSGTDITQRTEAVAALRTAEERMRFALQSANVGIWDMNYATGALRWSETLEAQYGLQPGTFNGTFESFLERIHPDDRESVLASMSKARETGTDFSLQHRALWPDGTTRWLNGLGRIHLDPHGKPLRGVGISLDVTERRALEAQYQQAQKMDAIGQLAGGVAHDFNNLLTVILGNCELLLDDADPDVQRQEDLSQIRKAGQSAAGLTRQLLAFSRKEIIEPTLLDLNVVLANMRAMLRRLIREDVEIVLSLRPDIAPIRADRGQIEQIVLNLSVNARDAMPKGGTLTIEVTNVALDDRYAVTHVGVTPGPYVALAVTDTGSGMTPEIRARLFEPFFTTKAAGTGTGLGLATVHGIATQSGGTIEVSSEIGTGTAFRVYFPRADAAELTVEAPPTVARARAGGETVLVVEDADGLRLLVTKLLERLGYTVLVAANAEQALQVCDANASIDVLLTDVVMPGASGPELTTQLAERRPDLRVIYMSGYTDEAIVQHGVLVPGTAFLHKPFTSEALGRKLREVLDKKR
jgi:PAS domain S-box-containing protein